MKSIQFSRTLRAALVAIAMASTAMTSFAGPVVPEPAATQVDRKIKYYRNPMGLPDTSPNPKKDSMGMDYVAVYADDGEAPSDPNTVKVSVEKVQRAGVVSQVAEMRQLADVLHVPGTVQLDESRERSITMRAEGFVEKVYASATSGRKENCLLPQSHGPA